MPLNKYAPQVATHRRTQTAILAATKQLIVSSGLKKMSMIEIADVSEVSRATLYNHYRDKESVVRALCESEMERLVTMAQSAPDATSALAILSLEISKDLALAAMRNNDPESLTLAFVSQDDQLWKAFAIAVGHLITDEDISQLAIRWLLGQVLYPLSAAQSRSQAEAITGFANI